MKKPYQNQFSIPMQPKSSISSISKFSPIDNKNYFENQVFIGENKVNLLKFNL